MNPSQPKNQKPTITTSVPGPQSKAWRAREDAHLAPGLQGYALMAGIAVAEAKGSAITDVDGKHLRRLHRRHRRQCPRRLRHRGTSRRCRNRSAAPPSVRSTSEARVLLGERLAARTPSKALHRLQLYSSGAEAVESALRLAKCHTRKHEFVSFWGGFHGKTMGVLSLMGSRFKEGLGPMVPGAHQVPYADCYRCPLGTTYPGCGMACVEFARKQLKVASAGSIAAIIVEPMQGTAGNVIPPKEFLPAVRDLACELGALLIADEMIPGMGRTGRNFGVDHTQVVPDIMTVGKAFGGGFPLSGIVTTDEISAAKPWSNPSGSSSSYGGNPLGAAAGAAALKIIDDEKLVENAAQVGATMLCELEKFVERYPFVGFVQGAGLFLRVELVKDKTGKEPLPRAVTERIFHECVRRGLLTMAYSANFRVQPALTIDEATAKNGLAVLAEVFDSAVRDGWWK